MNEDLGGEAGDGLWFRFEVMVAMGFAFEPRVVL